MSINHFMNKIKGKIGIDTDTIMCLLVIILVGVGSFGLGRLPVAHSKEESVIKLENINDTNVKEEIGNNREVINDNFTSREKMYVASKNGAVNASRSEVMYVKGPHPYIFSIFTKNNKDTGWEHDNEAWVLTRKLSKIIWDHFN